MSFSLQGMGLTHTNGHVALADIHLQAQQGECIALIGPSGAGKTSLLNAIGTAVPPTQGQITVLGQAVRTDDAALLRQLRTRIGTVHQSPPIPARQRVVTAVLAGKLGQWPMWKSLLSLVHPQDVAGAHEALTRVQLGDKLFERCDRISGGQLQRVCIARVLYQGAELVLADEPVSALDPALALSTVQLLVNETRARNATLVASLHAVDLARQCFDRLVGVRAGRIVLDAPAHAVTDAQLQALYANAEADEAHLLGEHGGMPGAAPAEGTGPIARACG